MLHDFAIDEEEYLDLVLWEVGTGVLVIQGNRGVQQGFPGLLGFGGPAHIYGVVKDLFDLDIMAEVIIQVLIVLGHSLA